MACRLADYESNARKANERCDLLTRILCNTMKRLPSYLENGNDDLIEFVKEDYELNQWWMDHQIADAERLHAIRQGALDKLTAEECEVLGLKSL